jgi:hypothetical protein
MKLPTFALIWVITITAVFAEEMVDARKLPSRSSSVPNVNEIQANVLGYYRGKEHRVSDVQYTGKFFSDGFDTITSAWSAVELLIEGEIALEIEFQDTNRDLPSELWSSKRPVWMKRTHTVENGQFVSRYYICVPEIDYFECLEFRNGFLQPLVSGEQFETLKAIYMGDAKRSRKNGHNQAEHAER